MKSIVSLYIFFFSILPSYCLQNDSLFRIIGIREKGDYFIILAHRNDSSFKIISKKDKARIDPDRELIKKGNSYYFDLGNQNNTITEDTIKPLGGIANYLDVKNKHIYVDGDTKIRFTRRFHYRLYITKNLMGLYYIPNP